MLAAQAGWSLWSLGWQALLWSNGVGWERGLYLWAAWITAPTLLAGVGFQLFERHLIFIFFLIGATALLFLLLACGVVYRHNVGIAFAIDVHLSLLLLLSTYFIALSVAVYWLRLRILGRAQQLLETDRQRHDAVWDAVLHNEADEAVSLASLARAITCTLPASAPRQLAHSYNRHGWLHGGCTGSICAESRYLCAFQCLWRCLRHVVLFLGQSHAYAVEAVVAPETTSVGTQVPFLRVNVQPICSLDQLFAQVGVPACAHTDSTVWIPLMQSHNIDSYLHMNIKFSTQPQTKNKSLKPPFKLVDFVGGP